MMTLVFFHAYADSLKRLLPEGETRFVSGKIEWFNDEAQMPHPDHILTRDEFERMPLIEPVYPLTEGLSAKVLAKAIRAALDKLPELPEWQDQAFLQRHEAGLLSAPALRALHHPETPAAMGPDNLCRGGGWPMTSCWPTSWRLTLVRANMKRAAGRRLPGTGDLREKLIRALPYSLTQAQNAAIGEILQRHGIARPHAAAAAGRRRRGQDGRVTAGAGGGDREWRARGADGADRNPGAAAFRDSFDPVRTRPAYRSVLLTGRDKGKGATRRCRGSRIRREAQLVIGTHALFQEDVAFHDLGLVVIDEQHRFGVHQRLALQAKAGGATDLLVMTATPIPRTLALTVYGDMDVSKLTEKPAGRLPIDTRVIPMSRLDDVVGGLGRSMAQGNRAYWVCPLVEESEVVDLAAAEDRFKQLDALFKGQVGLVHGRMKGPDKDKVMADFKSGVLSLLVSTTVIEVGVDVPEATVMVIENAERFGLAQLHQLRGRVGRGSGKSSCLLLYQEPLGETAKSRLSIMRETEDGFRIAEEDLKLRGAG